MPDDSLRTIRILDTATVNKIAAGEVVERPASVVKELVENAIDAGARTIRIDVVSVQGGIISIRVTDDGTGMSPADAEMAFAPHATSKISSVEDIFAIRTLGFRGEALASIAAVAKVTLVTKQKGDAAVAGTRIVILGGEVREKGNIGAPEGTGVLVEELFYNTPARKKFQKNLNTELARIHEVLEGIALAYPQISFRFSHNNREQFATTRTEERLDTIAQVFGNDCARELLPVTCDQPSVRVTGYISRPALSRKGHDRILVAVNGRYVSVPPVTAAIKEGYGTLLPRDRFPVAFLWLEIDTRLVDVNVHPTKKQVRLSKENEICGAVREAVRLALRGTDLIPGGRVPPRRDQVPADMIAGIIVLAYPLYSTFFLLEFFIILVGFWACVTGGVHLYEAFTKKDACTGILGMLSLLFGILLLIFPLISAALLPFVAGIFGIVFGLAAIVSSFAAKKAAPAAA